MATTRGARAESPDREEQPAAVVAMPQFIQPQQQPRRQDSADPALTTLHPAETAEETRGGHPEEDAADAAWDAEDADPEVAAWRAAAGSSPASTGKDTTALRPLVTAAQVKTAGTLVEAMLMGATTLMNRRSAKYEGDDRWLMSKDERERIATPFARILARRSPVPTSGEDASDIADGVEGVVGIIAYVLGQIMAERPQPAFVPAAVAEPAPPAPAGPGATLSPLDPAYRLG